MLAKNAKMPIFYDSTTWRKQQQHERREIYMVVIMMHVTLLLVSLRLNYSPPSHSEIFFYIESSLLLQFFTPNMSKNVYKDFPIILFLSLFFLQPKQMCKIIPSKTVQVNNCKSWYNMQKRAINCKQIADKQLSMHTHKPDRKYFSMWLTRQHIHCDFGYDYWFTKTHTMPWLTALKQE